MSHDVHRASWRRQVEEYKGRFRAAVDEVIRLQRQLASRAQLTSARDSDELQALRGTVEGISVFLGEKTAELQQLKIQLAYEQRAVTDTEAESEVLRKRHREAENESQRLRRVSKDMLLKKRELEEEVENLRQSWMRGGVDNSRSEGAELP